MKNTVNWLVVIVVTVIGVAILLLTVGCVQQEAAPPTGDEARELIAADALDDWCAAEINGTPVLKQRLHEEICE